MAYGNSLIMHPGIAGDLGADFYHGVAGRIIILPIQELVKLLHIPFQGLGDYAGALFPHIGVSPGKGEASGFPDIILSHVSQKADNVLHIHAGSHLGKQHQGQLV